MNKKQDVISNITPEQKQSLLAHFNEIYECKELTDHEDKMIYLAWMWANGIVYSNEMGVSEFNPNDAGVALEDYEITFEDESPGGSNLDLMYQYYNLDKIIKIMKW